MKDINELTKEELLSSEVLCEVFEEESAVVRNQLLMDLEDRAIELKCKTRFNETVKAYKEDYKKFLATNKQVAPQGDGFTHFTESKYPDMRCGSWIADDNGIKMHTQKNGEVTVFPHPILLVQKLVNFETGKEKIKIVYKSRYTWREIIVDKGVVANANKIVGLAEFGVSVTTNNARNLVDFLNDIENRNKDCIEERISTSKLGWIKGEFMPYGTGILFDNANQYKEAFECIQSYGSKEVWYSLVKEVRQYNKLSLNIYLASAFASVLVEPLNSLPFIVSIWGETGKGKTVALMLVTSVWANPGEKVGYMTDPKSTPTALELRLDFLNHLPMMIDDMAQVKERYHGNYSELVYYLCSGTGKDRANANLGLRAKTTWRNCIITNGEHSLVSETMQGGAVNRIIDIEMEEGLLFPNGNKVAEVLKENYGFAGQEFIEVIKSIGIEKIREIQQDFAHKIRDIAKASNTEKEQKQILPMSIILTADKLATEYIFKDDVYLDLESCVAILKSVGEVSENERAYEFIMSDVAVHMNNFKPDITGTYRGECWGVIEDGYVYIVVNIFNNMCDRGNFSRKSFLIWADRNNMLNTDKARKDKTKQINGSVSKSISIKMPEEDFMELTKDEQEKLPF